MEPTTPKVTFKISFVKPDGCADETECSKYMLKAFEMCTQNFMDVRWMNKETLNLEELQKNNFIVFQSFEGEIFKKVQDTQSVRIIGALCLLNCLSEGRPIPNVTWPIYNMAMADCCITCSHLPKKMKEDIKVKVQTMGGICTDSIFQICTHLVTDSVKSEKYLKAAESGIKIMLPAWVDAVWESSQGADIHCKDKEFEKFQCLPLQNLNICITGFHVIEERIRIQKLIQENGGIYSGQMNLNIIDILICKENTSSDKYKAAMKTSNVKCLYLSWITDSIEKGYALPDTDYHVKRGTSTPTKLGEFPNPNFSIMSAITNSTQLAGDRSVLQETINMTNIPNTTDNKKRKSGSMDEGNDVVDKIDLKRVKRAGSFLDGCSIYLAGFGSEQREKLCKILNFSGATRYEELSDRLTHIIAGDTSCQELKVIQSKGYAIPVVNVQWLSDCVEQEKMIPEEKYLIKSSPSKECGSPLSKKGLQLLRNNASMAEADENTLQENVPALESDINSEIMMQYLKPGLTGQDDDTLAQLLNDGSKFFNTKNETKQSSKRKQSDTTTNTSDTTAYSVTATQESTDLNPIFEGLKVMLANFDEEAYVELKDIIETFGGKVVSKSYKGIPDYAIVPAFSSEFAHTATEVVTDFWLTECWKDNELKDIRYYHRPLTVKNGNALKGCVVTISSYTSTERLFLIDLIKELGGISQEQLSRVEKDGILASTHLLSSVASGAKYDAAVKWGRPVINKDWLFECAKMGKIVSEKDYLINSTKVAKEDKGKEIQEESATSQKSSSSSVSKQRYSKKVTQTASELENNKTITPKKTSVLVDYQTPTSSKSLDKANAEEFNTPTNKATEADTSTHYCSQVTPVNKIMNQFRSNYMLGTPPSTPPLPPRWGDVDTPETPYGAFIRPNPSPHLRKEMLKWINKFPEKKRRDSTPLSELKKRLWNKICPTKDSANRVAQPNFDEPVADGSVSEELGESDSVSSEETNKQNPPETPDNIMVKSNIQQLKVMLSSSGGTRKIMKKRESSIPVEAETKSSQACTVDWEYAETDTGPRQVPNFMLSGVSTEEREVMVRQLQSLGVTVSELSNYDPASTHLLTNRPSRNEKMLSSMAGGKWILHPEYLRKSLEAEKLLKEDEFEYGNPSFSKDINIQFDRDTELRANAVHYWRKEINKRGYGAFHDMRAIVVSNKKESIVRVIEAGGGMVIDANPPFTDEIYATHCLLDTKFVTNMMDYIPLAQQGIYIFSTLYINDFLHRSVKDVKDCILPAFSKYYD